MKDKQEKHDYMKFRKEKCIPILMGILAVTIGVGVLSVCIRVCTKKQSAKDMSALIYEDLKEDILFVGDSQVNSDILPMELWQKYGYTSYILHANHNGIARSRAMLQLALQYSNPKVVVLSTDQYWEESPMETQIAAYHEYADEFPLTVTKIKSTFQWLQEPSQRAEILFPFLIYHNRWKELTEEDFHMSGSVLRGGAMAYGVEPMEILESPETSEPIMPENGERNLEEIEKFIQECKSQNIEVLLLTFPMELSTKRQSYLYELNLLAAKYNIKYLNLVEDHSMFNLETDFKDSIHMNVSGAKKMTDYIGKYINEHYLLENRMLDSDIAGCWNEDLKAYLDLKKQELANTQDIKAFLVQCRDENLDTALYVKWNSSIYKDNQSCELVKNIAYLEEFDKARQIGEDYFAFIDFGKGTIYEMVAPEEEEFDTSIGRMHFGYDEDGIPELFYAEGNTNWFAQGESEEGDIRITVFDRWTGEVVCTRTFDTQLVLRSEMYDEEIHEK